MPATSRTGLLPSKLKKIIRAEQQECVQFQVPNLVVPPPFTLRPFAGIYNPFPYGCSILCNHPTDLEARAIVQKAKDAWAAEGKSLIDLEEQEALQYCIKEETRELNDVKSAGDSKNNKKEIFHNYLELDSRPLTPAPTLASGTKTSPNVKTRRCFTPDPTSFIPMKEKTLLVLDLRRSHSQEAVSWQRETLTDYELDVMQDENFSRFFIRDSENVLPQMQNSSHNKRKKTPRKKSLVSSGTASSLKTQNSKDSDSKARWTTSPSPTRSSIVLDQEKDSLKSHVDCADDGGTSSSSEDAVVLKRRGKKRKGKKSGKNGLREGDKEFKGIPDPGETQVSALGSDSQTGSSRPSVSGEEAASVTQEEILPSATAASEQMLEKEKKSFLTSDLLKQLQRQLDQEVVESEMNIKRRKALEEALKHKPRGKNFQQGEEMKLLKKNLDIPEKNSDDWLAIPRVFSRRSARFELPMDTRLLKDMTPFEYIKSYSFPSPARLVLYNHVFNLYKEEPEDDEETERILLGKNVLDGLGKIMGRTMSSSEAEEFQDLVGWTKEGTVDFRTFVGIAAVCERIFAPRFSSKMPSQKEDPRHEVERADFESLDTKLKRLRPRPKLVHLLRSIRDL
ncbi:hypothetical protein RUM44_008850 [Polyplax serrata]|uniref:Uncharacterized protein n=1 Tax=Polyplax serrata TaxID=468196 RepID=A0ABR1B9G2_POLSC